MDIRIGYDMTFGTTAGLPMNLMLYVHPSRQKDLHYPDLIHPQPENGMELPVQVAFDAFGNQFGRIVSPGGAIRIWSENVIRDSGLPDPVPSNAAEAYQAAPEQLPPDVLQYLSPSRYCEVELLTNEAWNRFGHIPPGWQRATAVVDWVHSYVTFGYEYARKTKTAIEVFRERSGVCRDFQHLCITLHRALNLPARYVTGYLGDIGVPFNPAPMDFSAWHEVYLGGRWWAMDGRHNVPRIGRILMATGRDAVDVAITTQFGDGVLQRFAVKTEEVTADAGTFRNAGHGQQLYGHLDMSLFTDAACGTWRDSA